jgi:hypothetical protein
MKFLRSYLEDAGDFIVWLFKTLSSVFSSFAEELVEAFKSDPWAILAALFIGMAFVSIVILLTVFWIVHFPPVAFILLGAVFMLIRGVKS